jgi:hypothetical protein
MPGQIVGDDTVVLGDFFVFEQSAPLMVVTTRRVLADQWLSLPVLQVEDLVQQPIDVNVDVVPGHGRNLVHAFESL